MIIAGGRSKVWARSRSVPSKHPCQGPPALASVACGVPPSALPARAAGLPCFARHREAAPRVDAAMARRLAALLVLLAACAPRSSTERAPRDAVAPPFPDAAVAAPCAEPRSIAETTGLPAELAAATPLWEAIYPPRSGPSHGLRLYRDGRVYRYAHERRLGGVGAAEYGSAPPAWRLHARISQTGLTAMEQQLRRGVAMGMYAPCAPGPAPAEPPPTYRAFLDGRVHTRVQYVGTSDLAAPLMLPEDVLRSYTIAGAVPTEQP
jgi:hypothetical protein